MSNSSSSSSSTSKFWSELLPFLISPVDGGELEWNGEGFQSSSRSSTGKHVFPLIDGLPWLFPNLGNYESYWRQKFRDLIEFHRMKKESLKLQLSEGKLAPSTQKRLQNLIQAHRHNLEMLLKWLPELNQSGGMREFVIPSHQSLTLYHKNIFRDWAWQTQENEISLSLVSEILKGVSEIKKVAVLGSGAGRLATDLHHQQKWDKTLAIDFNPLLTKIAHRVQKQENVSLYDFAVAPLTLEQAAIKYQLKSPHPASEGLVFLLADAAYLPLRAGCMDMVLTPWVIDILPMNVRQLSTRINKILKLGGQWINFGPLGYASSNESLMYTEEELKENASAWGFQVEVSEVKKMVYLSHPNEVQSRNESVLLFRWTKVRDVEVEKINTYPEWLKDKKMAIPLDPQLLQQQALTRFQGDLFNSLDGRVSVEKLIELFVSHYQLEPQFAEDMIVTTLGSYYEKTQKK